jgi:hypothetical protein
MEQIGLYVPQMLELGQRLPHNAALAAHTIIRKSVVKLFGRVALKLLPPARSLPIQGTSFHMYIHALVNALHSPNSRRQDYLHQ